MHRNEGSSHYRTKQSRQRCIKYTSDLQFYMKLYTEFAVIYYSFTRFIYTDCWLNFRQILYNFAL